MIWWPRSPSQRRWRARVRAGAGGERASSLSSFVGNPTDQRRPTKPKEPAGRESPAHDGHARMHFHPPPASGRTSSCSPPSPRPPPCMPGITPLSPCSDDQLTETNRPNRLLMHTWAARWRPRHLVHHAPLWTYASPQSCVINRSCGVATAGDKSTLCMACSTKLSMTSNTSLSQFRMWPLIPLAGSTCKGGKGQLERALQIHKPDTLLTHRSQGYRSQGLPRTPTGLGGRCSFLFCRLRACSSVPALSPSLERRPG